VFSGNITNARETTEWPAPEGTGHPMFATQLSEIQLLRIVILSL